MPEIGETLGETVIPKVENQVESKSIAKLEQQLETDSIKEHWKQIATFLEPIRSTINPNEIQIDCVPGEMGKGTLSRVDPRRLTIEMPNEQVAIRSLQNDLKSTGVNLTTEEAVSLLYTMQAQTTLHEGIHVLLDSRPGSYLAQAVENTGITNEQGNNSTLLDEGLTYALQNYFAPTFEKLGKLTVRPYTIDELKAEPNLQKRETLRRKILGNDLSLLVQEYVQAGKKIDDGFIKRAIIVLKEINKAA
jgi:hypothetical protein